MPVLALDSAGRLQSVALIARGRVLSHAARDDSLSHSETILGSVERVLSEARVPASELTAIAVTSGPGAFTGLRVGMATAKGLALSTGIPLAGISTLRALAEALATDAAAPVGTIVCGLMDAGRGQFYRGIFSVIRHREGRRVVAANGEESLRDPGLALAGLASGALIGGEGADRHRDLLLPQQPARAMFSARVPPLAPSLALIAEELEAAGDLAGWAVAPNYLREEASREPRVP